MLTPIMSAHLFTVLPAALLGAYLMLNPKGTPVHRLLGKVYMVLMLTTATLSLLIPATVGPQLVGHLGLIHILSFVVLFSGPTQDGHGRRIFWWHINCRSLYFGAWALFKSAAAGLTVR